MEEEMLIIKDRSVIDFYKKHNLDVTITNKIIIELLDKILTESQGTITTMITTEILSNIKNTNSEMILLKHELNSMRNHQALLSGDIKGLSDLMMKLNSDVSNSIISKLFDIKQSYIDDVKSILTNNDASNTLRLSSLLEKENNIMIEKTLRTINENIPKSNNESYKQIEQLMIKYKDELNKTNNSLSLESMISIIDNKYSQLIDNIKTPMENYINEHVTKNINEMKEDNIKMKNSQEIINTKVVEYINKFDNSTDKGNLSEAKLKFVLQTMFQSGEIIDTSCDNHKCDLLLKRINRKDILIENKDYKVNVPKCEITKFVSDMTDYNSSNHENANGLMISQNSGIALKNNFQIDIIDGVNVLLYLHNCEYNQDLIQCAIDVIDHLTLLLKDINSKSDNTCNISNDILSTINTEYTQFINKKLSLKNYINDCTKKMNAQISEFELPTLSLLLKQKYSTVIVTDLTCKHCEKYVGINKKSLSVHYRSCIKIKNNTDNESSDNVDSPILETPIVEPPKVVTNNKKKK